MWAHHVLIDVAFTSRVKGEEEMELKCLLSASPAP